MGNSCGTKEKEEKYVQVFYEEDWKMPSEAICEYHA
jgi:hypothetical protein